MEMTTGQEHKVFRSRIDRSGRIVLPKSVRAALGVRLGDSVLVLQEGDSVQLSTPTEALHRAQEFFAGLAPREVSFVDELIQEHRDEVFVERE